MLEATSRKGFEAVPEKFMGRCLRQMQKVNTNFRNNAFIVKDDAMLEDLLNYFFEKLMSGIDNVAFSVFIDTKRVLKARQLFTSCKIFTGGAHPNHFISV